MEIISYRCFNPSFRERGSQIEELGYSIPPIIAQLVGKIINQTLIGFSNNNLKLFLNKTKRREKLIDSKGKIDLLLKNSSLQNFF